VLRAGAAIAADGTVGRAGADADTDAGARAVRVVEAEVEEASAACAVGERRGAAESGSGRHAACRRDDWRRRHSAARTTAHSWAKVEGAAYSKFGAAHELGSHFTDEDGWIVGGEVGDAV
jgi:hypothetical protein